MERELPGKTVNHTKVGLNNGLAVIKIIYVLPVRYFTLIHYAASRRQLWVVYKSDVNEITNASWLPANFYCLHFPAGHLRFLCL